MAFVKFKVDLTSTDARASRHHQKKGSILRPQETLTDHPSLEYLKDWQTQHPALKVPKSWIVQADEHPLVQYLETLSQTLLQILCFDRDFTHPLITKHMSPDFSAQQDGHSNSRSREEHFAICAKAMDEMPGYGWEVIETVVEIHEGGKKAKLWTFKRLSGLFGPSSIRYLDVGNGIVKESVSVMKWELQGETWVCKQLKKMNGVSGVA
jgi:hypothetical protein